MLFLYNPIIFWSTVGIPDRLADTLGSAKGQLGIQHLDLAASRAHFPTLDNVDVCTRLSN